MSEWEKTTLGAIATYQNGYPFKPVELGGSKRPVIRIKQLLDEQAEVDYTDVDVPDRVLIDDGDLIFSWSATLASVVWRRGPAALNQHLFRVSPAPGVDKLWLHYCLDHAIDVLSTKTHGTTMRHVTKKVLEAHEVALPPLREQRRIVDVMAAVDAQIEALDAEVEYLWRTWRALVNQLDESTHRLSLGDGLLAIQAGKSPQGVERRPGPGERAVLKISAVGRARFNPVEVKTVAPDVDLPEASRVAEGDVLLVRCNAVLDRVGTVCQVPPVEDNLYLCDKTLRLVADESRLAPNYLVHAMASPSVRSQIEERTAGSDMRNIGQKTLRDITIPTWELSDQHRYGAGLDGLVNQAHTTETALASLRMSRATLLSALLSQQVEIPESYDALLDDIVEVSA